MAERSGQAADLDTAERKGRIDQVRVAEGQLWVNREAYQAILIPYAQCLPEKLLKALDQAAQAGVPVLFMDGCPEHVYYASEFHAVQAALDENPLVEVCGLAQAADWMKGRGLVDICVQDSCPDLRFMHYEREEGSVYFFTNESKWNTVDTLVTLKEDSRLVFYDAMEDVRYPLLEEKAGAEGVDGRVTFRLVLEPYSSVFVVPGALWESGAFAEKDASVDGKNMNTAEMSGKPGERPIPVVDGTFWAGRREKSLDGAWRISVLREDGGYEALEGLNRFANISAADILPEYSGRIRYEISFELEQGEAGAEAVLDLGQVYEISDVELNGSSVGCRICPPHVYRLECRPGRNELRVTVTNTFAKAKMGNAFDRAMPQEPSGLLGPVRLYL